MKKRILIGAGLIALAAILASVPYAFAGRGLDGHRGAADEGLLPLGHFSRLQSKLGLSDQQMADIKTSLQASRDQNAGYRQQLQAGRRQIAQMLIANPGDLTAAQALLDQQIATETVMKKNALAAMARALQVLTPEQRTQLQTVVSEHLQRMEGRRGVVR